MLLLGLVSKSIMGKAGFTFVLLLESILSQGMGYFIASLSAARGPTSSEASPLKESLALVWQIVLAGP